MSKPNNLQTVHFSKEPLDYTPRPCNHSGRANSIYTPFCDGLVGKERQGFSVCTGCIESADLGLEVRLLRKSAIVDLGDG